MKKCICKKSSQQYDLSRLRAGVLGCVVINVILLTSMAWSVDFQPIAFAAEFVVWIVLLVWNLKQHTLLCSSRKALLDLLYNVVPPSP